jgi:hypothetical protein
MRFDGEVRMGALWSVDRRGDLAPRRTDIEAILDRWEAMAMGKEPLRCAP